MLTNTIFSVRIKPYQTTLILVLNHSSKEVKKAMSRTIPMESVKVDFMRVNFFSMPDADGHNVYIIDPDAPAIHIISYDGPVAGIRQHVIEYLEAYQERA